MNFPADQSQSTPTGQWILRAQALLSKIEGWLAQSGLLPSMGATVTVPADSNVSAQIIERVRNPFTITVAPRLALPSTIAANNANYITITVSKYNSNYSTRTPLYALSSQAGLAAGVHSFVQVGLAADLTLAAGESLAWDVAKTGTGPATTGGRIDFPG